MYIAYTKGCRKARRIDRARVLAEALAMADEQGLDAVTMAGVAERLGVTPMALYRHVANKADLLDGVVRTPPHRIPTASV